MGGTKDFKEQGVYQYKTTAVINGVKVLVGNNEPKHNLPQFAGNSIFYARAVEGEIKQIMIYRNGKKVKRIDTGHKHVNKTTGKVFEKYEIHVQDFVSPKKKGGKDTTDYPKSKLEKALAKLIGRKVP